MSETTGLYIFSGQDILLPSLPPNDPPAGANEEQVGPLHSPAALAGLEPSLRRDFVWEGRSYAAVSLSDEAAARLGLTRLPLRQAMGSLPIDSLKPAIKAAALLNWLEGALRCGACGTPLEDDRESSGRRCPACGRMHFPRISPAIIVLIRKDDRALLAHNARFPGGRFGLIAGFVEAGESLEETVAREVREEAGIEIAELRYLRSQPWPFPDSLMFAFTARWASGEARPDGEEIVELRWCRGNELPSVPPSGSVARWLIDEFARGAI